MKQQTFRYSGTKMGKLLISQGRRFDWFAEQMGVSGSTVTRWAKGERTMSHDAAERAARLLNVPFFLLFESPIGDNMRPDGRKTETAA